MSDEERARDAFAKAWENRAAGTWVCVDDDKGVVYPRPAFYRWLASTLSAARAEEREACAKIADEYEKDSCGNDCMGGCADCAWFTARRDIAAAIRGRE